MGVSPEAFKQTLRCWASGITVIVTRREGGIHAMTATSFCSLSIDPPLIIVAVDKRNRTHERISEQKSFGVMILNSDQEDISNRAAGFKGEEGNFLLDVPHHTEATGAPILDKSLAWMDCSLYAAYEGGDHTIFVGKVEAAGEGEGKPLLWYSRGYTGLTG